MSPIYDPLDGTVDPRPRCTGHCCKCFSVDFSDQDPKDEEMVKTMLIPLGVIRGQAIYTCKHLGRDGNCLTYETRPQMCRDFPGKDPCPYRNCSSHGHQSLLKRAMNWLRE